MTILYVLSEPCYPVVNGVRIPAYHAVRLMARDNKLMVASLVSPECEPYDLNPLEGLCEKVMTVEFPQVHPLLVALKALLRREIYYMERFRSERFRAQLKEMIAEFKPDVVHFDYILTTQYIDCVPCGVGTVASINDSFAFSMENEFKQKLARALSRKIYRRLQYYQVRHFEKTFYPNFDIVHTMTEKDAGFLRSLNPNIVTEAIPNGTSVEEFDDKGGLFVGQLKGLQEFGASLECTPQGLPAPPALYTRVIPRGKHLRNLHALEELRAGDADEKDVQHSHQVERQQERNAERDSDELA